jgi:hypothetical protein
VREKEKIQDFWKRLKKKIRQLSKGMGANLDRVMRKQKEELDSKIEGLDRKAKRQDLDSEEWKYRYKLERDLEDILAFEEKDLATKM